MNEKSVTTGSRQFIREYRRFKQLALQGQTVHIKDRQGSEFLFMRVNHRQHPPRKSEKGLDPKDFANIDLDEPAVPSEVWEANQ
jgi:hypothetical protein